MYIKKDLSLIDPEPTIRVRKEHLEAISYLLEAAVRHEKTLLEEHNLHIKNASEVITKALEADKPNQPMNAFWGGDYEG